MSNLHKFQTESDYYASMLASPSVSLVAATNAVHYDSDGKSPSSTPMLGDLKITYNVDSTSAAVTLFNKSTGSGSGSGSEFMPYQMWVDGVEVTPTDVYVFSTIGNHIVEYNIGSSDIPNAFKDITTIVKVEIGENITYLSSEAFMGCNSINEVTCYCINSPSFGGENVFTSYSIPLYIPSTANIGSYEIEYWVTRWNMNLYAIKA